jgi:hypothetical protein
VRRGGSVSSLVKWRTAADPPTPTSNSRHRSASARLPPPRESSWKVTDALEPHTVTQWWTQVRFRRPPLYLPLQRNARRRPCSGAMVIYSLESDSEDLISPRSSDSVARFPGAQRPRLRCGVRSGEEGSDGWRRDGVRACGGRSTAPDGPSGVDCAVKSEAGKRARRVGAIGAELEVRGGHGPQQKTDPFDLEEFSCGYGGGGRGLPALVTRKRGRSFHQAQGQRRSWRTGEVCSYRAIFAGKKKTGWRLGPTCQLLRKKERKRRRRDGPRAWSLTKGALAGRDGYLGRLEIWVQGAGELLSFFYFFSILFSSFFL